MYSTTSQFDGNKAFAGGGYMPSQATQTVEPSFFPSKSRDAQVLLPLTVKQISDAFQSNNDSSSLLVDGVEVNNVTLVGKVWNKAGRITAVTFVLDDGTGRIECNKWIQEAVETNEVEAILDGMYVRVHGHLKGFQGKGTLNIFSIRPVLDFNEIANHFVECIYVHLYNTKLRDGVSNHPEVTNPMLNIPSKDYRAPQNQFPSQYNSGVQKRIEDMVLDVLHLPANSYDFNLAPCYANKKISHPLLGRARDDGVHIEAIAMHLNIPKSEIMSAVKILVDDFRIYETKGDHYRSIING